MNLTIKEITEIIMDDDDFREENKIKVQKAIRAIVAEYQKLYGILPVAQETGLGRGRPNDKFLDKDLYVSNKKYLDSCRGTPKSSDTLRMKIIVCLQQWLVWMGVNENASADESPEAIRNRIFKKRRYENV